MQPAKAAHNKAKVKKSAALTNFRPKERQARERCTKVDDKREKRKDELVHWEQPATTEETIHLNN